MHQLIRTARVVVLVALTFTLALGGTAWAGKLITGKQVKNGSLSTADIRSVTGDDIADLSLTDADFAELVQGPQGARGEEGREGDMGPLGPPGTSGLTYVIESTDVPKDSIKTWSAFCPDQTKAVGGGLSSGSPSLFWLQTSGPDISGNSWAVTAQNRHDKALTAYAWAICARTS